MTEHNVTKYRCPVCGNVQEGSGRCSICSRLLNDQCIYQDQTVTFPAGSDSGQCVRICPTCGHVNPQAAFICEKDGTGILIQPLISQDSIIEKILALVNIKSKVPIFISTGNEIIGRGHMGKIVLKGDRYISRKHFEVQYHERKFWIRNLSYNGTYLSEKDPITGKFRMKRIGDSSWVPIKPGNLLLIGQTTLLVRVKRKE